MTPGKYANVNGLKMYYEIHGQGQPLILLHGGLGTIGMFEQILPALSERRQVIGVELQVVSLTPKLQVVEVVRREKMPRLAGNGARARCKAE